MPLTGFEVFLLLLFIGLAMYGGVSHRAPATLIAFAIGLPIIVWLVIWMTS